MNMRQQKSVMVTTSSEFNNSEIKAYLGIVTIHLVAGTNIFSEIFASASDIFGGRSKSSEKQLDSIKEDAIKALKQQTLKRNGNGIIGVHIDVDEISGNNKSMFMITAYGTAVSLEFHEKHLIGCENISPLSGQVVAESIARKNLLKTVKGDPLFCDDTLWGKVVSLSIPALAPYIISDFEKKPRYAFDQVKNRICEYALSIEYEFSIDFIYDVLPSFIDESSMFNFIMKFIKDNQMVDYTKIEDLLKSDHFLLRKAALNILMTYKQTYNSLDVVMLQNIKQDLGNMFPQMAVFSAKKSIIGGDKNQWTCAFGHDGNHEESSSCKTCFSDRFGFHRDDTPVLEVQLRISDILEELSVIK